MEPIIGLKSGAAYLPEAVSDKKESVEAPGLKEEEKEPAIKPVVDEYIPGREQEPSGLYGMGKDPDGNPKVWFDDPKRKKSDDKEEEITGNTDQVDREIRKLKQEQEELKRQLRTETDETKHKALETKLAQVERELNQKDNEAYRRQHTVFS